MLAIFIGICLAFIESGFTYTLIQRKELTEVEVSSVFFFNIVVGLICSMIMCLAAPCIASFYNMPVLKPLTRLIAANLFIGSFGSVQATLLTKELNFKKICIISIISTIISGVVAIWLALNLYGVWSLAIQTIVGTSITTLLLWTMNSWRPRLVFSIQSIRNLSKFGSFMFFSVLVDVFYTRLNTIVIGKWYSADDLGYYTRADQTQQLPGLFISRIIGRVAFPVFAAAYDDQDRLTVGLRKALIVVMMINIPLMLGLAVTAKSIIILLFGSQWIHSVIYLQILCFGGWFVPMNVLNMNVLAAQGHSDLFFRLELVKKTVGVLLIGTACFFSITMIALSTAVTGLICFFINAHYSGTILKYGAIKQLVDISPYFAASIVMAGFAWAVTLLPVDAPIVLVCIQIAVGFIVYCVFCYLLKLNEFLEALQICCNYFCGLINKSNNV
jgi:O-antigen/teichoic acid export membrane protein